MVLGFIRELSGLCPIDGIVGSCHWQSVLQMLHVTLTWLQESKNHLLSHQLLSWQWCIYKGDHSEKKSLSPLSIGSHYKTKIRRTWWSIWLVDTDSVSLFLREKHFLKGYLKGKKCMSVNRLESFVYWNSFPQLTYVSVEIYWNWSNSFRDFVRKREFMQP